MHAINSMLAAKYHPKTVMLVSFLRVAMLTLKQVHWLLKKTNKKMYVLH